MTCLLAKQKFECRVSSVLNKNVKSYGKQFMFDNETETCWNSDSGSPQWVFIKFDQEVDLSCVQIQFQGGFAGKKCSIEAGSDLKNLDHIQDIYPEDIKCSLPIRANNLVMANEREIDIFRDTYIRYLGYTNEVGEAFRSIVPKSVVWSSYVAACGYVVADTIHKGIHVYNEDHSASKVKRLLLSTSDTLIWQGFASVIIPGLTINRLCATVRYIQSKSNKPRLRSPWISTLIGLASIPLIIHPIDVLVEDTMNATYRQWTGYKPPEPLKST